MNGIEGLKELLKGNFIIAKKDSCIGNPSYDEYGIWSFNDKHIFCVDSDGFKTLWSYGSVKNYKYPFFKLSYPLDDKNNK